MRYSPVRHGTQGAGFPGKEPYISYGTKTVLLIDDEPGIVRMAKEHPERLGILYYRFQQRHVEAGPLGIGIEALAMEPLVRGEFVRLVRKVLNAVQGAKS